MGVSYTGESYQWYSTTKDERTYKYTNTSGEPKFLNSITVKFARGASAVYYGQSKAPNTKTFHWGAGTSYPTRTDAVNALRAFANYTFSKYSNASVNLVGSATATYSGNTFTSNSVTVSNTCSVKNSYTSFNASSVSYEPDDVNHNVNYLSGKASIKSGSYNDPSNTVTFTFTSPILVQANGVVNITITVIASSSTYIVFADSTGVPSVSESSASYTVTYNAGDATSGTAPASQTKTQNVVLTLRSNSGNLAKSNTTGTAGTITFNANGGSIVSGGTTRSSTLTYSYAPSGWNTSSGQLTATYSFGGSYTGNASLTLYPAWTRTGSYASVTSPTTSECTKTGYTLLGWSTSSTATSATYSPGASIPGASSATYYAVWKINTWTVKYNGGDATSGTAPASQTKTYNVNLTLASNPGFKKSATTSTGMSVTITFNKNSGDADVTRSSAATITNSYSASGWGTSSGTTTKAYDFSEVYSGNAALNLYPAWSVTSTTTYANVTAPTASQMTRTGYTLKGFATSASGSVVYQPGASIPVTAAKTYYAIWEAIKYTITVYARNSYNNKNISKIGDYSVNATSTFNPASKSTTITGYTYSSSDASFTVTGSVTKYCYYTPNIYTCTLNTDGALSYIYLRYADAFYSNSACTNKITSVTKPSKVGYTFTGYFLNTQIEISSTGSILVSTTAHASNWTIVANFTLVSSTSWVKYLGEYKRALIFVKYTGHWRYVLAYCKRNNTWKGTV